MTRREKETAVKVREFCMWELHYILDNITSSNFIVRNKLRIYLEILEQNKFNSKIMVKLILFHLSSFDILKEIQICSPLN